MYLLQFCAGAVARRMRSRKQLRGEFWPRRSICLYSSRWCRSKAPRDFVNDRFRRMPQQICGTFVGPLSALGYRRSLVPRPAASRPLCGSGNRPPAIPRPEPPLAFPGTSNRAIFPYGKRSPATNPTPFAPFRGGARRACERDPEAGGAG